jgi:hypothetical protein
VKELLSRTIALWQESHTCLPPFARSFSPEEQAAREKELEAFLGNIQSECRSLPRTRSDRQAAHQRITSAFVRFAAAGLDLEPRHLDLLLDGGFAAIGTHLARQARRFDPAVSTADILQASRNAWTACALQVLLGHQMRLTPAIFAYSMLYPYTDNYLDNPAVSREAKLGFSLSFGRRLAGEVMAPANQHEAAIWRLVGMIEEQYSRTGWPQVYTTLLAIHHAQEDSLRLQRQGVSWEGADVLELSFAKGGASVLADAYLAAGSLSREEAQFGFDWGVALQLADDLQDVRQDRQDGVLTPFSQVAGKQPLDELTSRTLNFSASIARRMDSLAASDSPALKELVRKSASSLLIRSAGGAGDLHTAEYVAELETHSPFRFAFLARQQEQIMRRRGAVSRLFEAFLEGDEDEPAFPLLPSSLMPRF